MITDESQRKRFLDYMNTDPNNSLYTIGMLEELLKPISGINTPTVLAEAFSELNKDGQARVGQAVSIMITERIFEISDFSQRLDALITFIMFLKPCPEAMHDVLKGLINQPPDGLPFYWHGRILCALDEYEIALNLPPRSLEFWREQWRITKGVFPALIWGGIMRWAYKYNDLSGAFKELQMLCLASGENGAKSIAKTFSWVTDVLIGENKLRDLLREHNSDLPIGIRSEFNEFFVAIGIIPPWPEIVGDFDWTQRLRKRLSQEDIVRFETMRDSVNL